MLEGEDKIHSQYQEIATQWTLIKSITAMQIANPSNCEVYL